MTTRIVSVLQYFAKEKKKEKRNTFWIDFWICISCKWATHCCPSNAYRFAFSIADTSVTSYDVKIPFCFSESALKEWEWWPRLLKPWYCKGIWLPGQLRNKWLSCVPHQHAPFLQTTAKGENAQTTSPSQHINDLKRASESQSFNSSSVLLSVH